MAWLAVNKDGTEWIMDNARKARSRLVRALGVLGKSVRRERARVRINRDRTPQGVCLQTTR